MTTERGVGLCGQMKPAEVLLDLLIELGRLTADDAQPAGPRRKEAPRSRKGTTLRPGAGTPLWSAIVEKLRPYLRVRGAKAQLARTLDLPRQRMHDYFVSGTQMPDAERMLRILLWLAARETDNTAIAKNPKPLAGVHRSTPDASA